MAKNDPYAARLQDPGGNDTRIPGDSLETLVDTTTSSWWLRLRLVPHIGCSPGVVSLGRLGHVGTLAFVHEDVFQDRRSVGLPGHTDLWEIADFAVNRMHRALNREASQIATEVAGEAEGGSIFNRDSLQAVMEAFDEHDLRPALVHYYDYAIVNPGGRMDPTVHILLGFPGSPLGGSLHIMVSGTNKVFVDGLLAEAERVVGKVKAEVEQDNPTASSPTGPQPQLSQHPASSTPLFSGFADLPAEDAKSVGQFVKFLRSTAGEPTQRSSPAEGSAESWLRRTWRDHTISFALTIIGGLVVTILAVWLGIG